MVLKEKNIILGVTGAISAYKALFLTRLLVKAEARVWPVMTKSAAEFVTPLSFSTLAKKEVYRDLFQLSEGTKIGHIEIAEKADLIIIAPATANIIGKIASGIADDLLTTIVMAAKAPVLIAPSMNCNMWENKIVAGNVEKLKKLGYTFAGPDAGGLACGYEGKGRLVAAEDIIEAALDILSPKDLTGEKVLVSAGPTREAIDPVRFVSNASSGRMGYAIAMAARRRGAEVVLISGPSHLPPPHGVTFVRAVSAEEMYDLCVTHYPQSTVVIMAAAIADYRPATRYDTKVKKDADRLNVELERTADVLKHMGKKKKKDQTLVGFALETEDLEKNAKKKLKDKNLDLVIANGAAGLDSKVNEVMMINREGDVELLPLLPKDEVADRILDTVIKLKGS
ncbi:MAG: bifunctional phosphopantothenoylcysteine decarboxylase/phosphopantothenate--cysteine ligase CoaBC [Deltaproteobacteria bacterium]|nr:bifunctional phosphopantothenoylcysteine decarboxylase/phosphopantothenate--cysteine ligase CoaBC [Deltaproteobacteria bacterium]